MNSDYLFDDLKSEAKRLLRYRFLLAFTLLTNCLLVAHVPWTQIRSATATSPAAGMTSPETDSAADSETPQLPNSSAIHPASPSASPLRVDRVNHWPSHGFALEYDSFVQGIRRKSLESLSNAGHWLEDQLLAAVTTESETESHKTAAVRPQVHFSPVPTETTESPKQPLPPPGVTPASELVFGNPPENAGVIHFLVDERSMVLLPGETHKFSGVLPRHVQFHRGGTFGNEETTVSAGNFEFRVTRQGWALIRLSPSQ